MGDFKKLLILLPLLAACDDQSRAGVASAELISVEDCDVAKCYVSFEIDCGRFQSQVGGKLLEAELWMGESGRNDAYVKLSIEQVRDLHERMEKAIQYSAELEARHPSRGKRNWGDGQSLQAERNEDENKAPAVRQRTRAGGRDHAAQE